MLKVNLHKYLHALLPLTLFFSLVALAAPVHMAREEAVMKLKGGVVYSANKHAYWKNIIRRKEAQLFF